MSVGAPFVVVELLLAFLGQSLFLAAVVVEVCFFGAGCGLWLMFIFWCFEASGRCLICFLALAALPLCCISLLVGCGWPWSFPA